MTDQIEQDIARGNRANMLLNDSLLSEAFDSLEKQYVEYWMKSDARDQDGRERVHIAINIIGKVKTHLEQVAMTGRVAKADLERMTPKKRG